MTPSYTIQNTEKLKKTKRRRLDEMRFPAKLLQGISSTIAKKLQACGSSNDF